MIVYKLTDADDRTRNDTQWGEGITHTASGNGELCTANWLHCYSDPVLAVLMDPIHGGYGDNGHLWKCETPDQARQLDDKGTKLGVSSLTTLELIDLPRVTLEQRIRFAIYCARQVTTNTMWVRWSDEWLRNENRARTNAIGAAIRAAAYAGSAADAAAYAAYAAAAATEDAYTAAYTAAANVGAADAAVAAAAAGVLDLPGLAARAIADERQTSRVEWHTP